MMDMFQMKEIDGISVGHVGHIMLAWNVENVLSMGVGQQLERLNCLVWMWWLVVMEGCFTQASGHESKGWGV
jgi:hypothetical protein